MDFDNELEGRDQASARRRPCDCTDSCEGELGDVVAKRGESGRGKHSSSEGVVLDKKSCSVQERQGRRHKPVSRNTQIIDLSLCPRAPLSRVTANKHRTTQLNANTV